MPVIPPGIPPYHIHKPCTMGDKGIPSFSIMNDLQRVLNMIDDERHLTAHSLYTSILHRIQVHDESSNENALNDNQNSHYMTKKQKSKTFSSSFIKRSSGSGMKQQPQQLPPPVTKEEDEEIKQVKEIIFKSKKHIFDKLENRSQLFRTAQMNFSTSNDNNNNENDNNNNHENTTNEWIYASKHFGITTYYRREISDQSLSIKLEGTVEGAALFEQICVLKEVDLHYLWSPFCTSSLTIANLDKLDIVGWFLIGLPNFGLARDGCYRAIGCDNIEEDGSIILTGRGLYDHPPYISPSTTTNSNGTASPTSLDSNHPIDTFLSSDPILDKLDIPPVPTRMGSGRMTIRKFDAIIHITSPTSVRTQLIANMNPNISFLPNTLLEFGMKHLASVVLSKLQNAARKATLQPVTNLHAIKMREEKEFYQTWLLEKFKSVCAARGWDMPPVAAFNLTEAEEYKAQRYTKKNKKDIHGYERAQTFPVDHHRDENDNTAMDNHSLNHDDIDTNSEAMSALSTDTGRASVWSNNPISSYLRETERKIQQRKAEAEAESRQRAVERLLPKERSFNDEERLNALRLAKYRRLDLTSTTSTSDDNSTAVFGASKSYYQRLAYQLYNHSPQTRYCIVLTLVCVLLIMLHAGVIVETSSLLSTHATMPWYINRSKDIGTIMYIFLCTIPHFLLVNVSLIYAFDALEIGSKSGRQAKTYYSDNVNGASIVASFGIATISVALAIFKAFIRSSIWLSAKLWGLLGIHLLAPLHTQLNDAIQLLPKDTLTMSESVVALGASTIRTLIWIVSFVTSLIWRYLFESNFIGQGIARCISAGVSASWNVVKEANTFVYFSIKSFDGEVTVKSWRVEAFTTARFLFMNTAVFLLVMLTLFYLTSRTSSAPKKSKLSNNLVDLDDDDKAISTAPQITDRYATIPEERIVEVADLHSFNPAETSSADGATSTKRRRFRFRNRKVSSSPNMNTPLKKKAPMERNRIQHMKTM